MTFHQQIKQESLKGFKRVLKSVKSLESKQSHPVLSVSATVSSPPTTGEINSAFDTPANVGTDFIGLIIDSVNSNEWLVWTDGSSWYVMAQSQNSVVSGARVSRTTSLTIPHNTATVIPFTAETFDTDNYHNNAVNNSRLTVPTDGIYTITGSVLWQPNSNGHREMFIFRNGTTVIALNRIQAVASINIGQNLTTTYQLSAGNYVQLFVLQTSTANVDILPQSDYAPRFSIVRN